MTDTSRNGLKWGIPEILRLQREHELLDLSVDEIALLHQRSPLSIAYKLEQEGFARNIVDGYKRNASTTSERRNTRSCYK